jgi:hypothetical protein
MERIIEREFTPEELQFIREMLEKMLVISDLSFYCPIWEKLKGRIPEELLNKMFPSPFPISEDCYTLMRKNLMELKEMLSKAKLTEVM